MLIVFLLGLCFYLLPLIFIAYAFFLITKTKLPGPKGFKLKIALYVIPSLLLLHVAYFFNSADRAGQNERRRLRNGLYINAVSADTVKLSGDSVYVLYAHKKTKKLNQSASLSVDTALTDDAKTVRSQKTKKTKKRLTAFQEHFDLKEDLASTYRLTRDTVMLFSPGWNREQTSANLNHFLKKLPLSGDVTDEILIKDETSDKIKQRYRFSLNHDTLTLNNGKTKDESILYIKKNPVGNGKSTTAK